jgi:hypothetical protein
MDKKAELSLDDYARADQRRSRSEADAALEAAVSQQAEVDRLAKKQQADLAAATAATGYQREYEGQGNVPAPTPAPRVFGFKDWIAKHKLPLALGAGIAGTAGLAALLMYLRRRQED